MCNINFMCIYHSCWGIMFMNNNICSFTEHDIYIKDIP